MATNALSGFLTVASAADQHKRVDAILDAVRHHLDMEIAFASRFVDGQRQFTHLSSDLTLPAKPGDSEPLEDGFCWHIQQGRLPELIHNAQDLDFAHNIAITGALPVGCHISVPLRLKNGDIYGSFCCLSRTPDYTLTERDLSTVRAFAELARDQIEAELAAEADHIAIVERVEQAIAGGQPTIFLQPIHKLDGSGSAGAEALARFADAATRPPSDWFLEAGEVGHGVALELAAIRRGLAALPYVPADHYLSLNASPETVLSGLLPDLLAEAGGRQLVVEITEHVRVDDYQLLRPALDALRPYARIAVDDVGAGYAGLRHIIALGPDILKLDLSLTRDIHRDPAKRALAVAMVNFAGRIDASLVAEGIEVPEEAAVLRDLGAQYGQGYLFARPMPLVAAQQHMLGVDRVAGPQPRPAPLWKPRLSARH